MPRGELHVQLSVNYSDDEKLADVSRSARLLYVDALCDAKKLLNDGVVTVRQIERLMLPERAAAARKVAAELVASGAWTWDGQRYHIAAWLKRNKSREQVIAARTAAEEAAALGHHKRWHENRNKVDPQCQHCQQPHGVPDAQPHGVDDGVQLNGGQCTETETETETEIRDKNSSSTASPPRDSKPAPSRRQRKTAPAVIADDDPDFVRFWAAYPRRIGKLAARKAWTRAIAAGTPTDTIIEGASRFTAQCGNEDPKFIPYPASWLNGERWTDPVAPAPARNGGLVSFWDA